uniref:Mucin-like protein n=2 Tax=Tetraselmis sp. GSL018 TaxID=582737 RepID=A0A061QM48_9CHLO
MAIIALKEMEEAAVQSGQFAQEDADRLHEKLDRAAGATYSKGSGERFYAHIATFPKFEYITPEEASRDKEIHQDPVSIHQERLTRKYDAAGIQEFQERLDFNLVRVGKTLRRGRRRKRETHAGTAGATILIKPVGKESAKAGLSPWVASPEGKTRELTEDEALLLRRKTPRRRRRHLW